MAVFHVAVCAEVGVVEVVAVIVNAGGTSHLTVSCGSFRRHSSQ